MTQLFLTSMIFWSYSHIPHYFLVKDMAVHGYHLLESTISVKFKLVALSFQKQKLRWGAKHSPPACRSDKFSISAVALPMNSISNQFYVILMPEFNAGRQRSQLKSESQNGAKHSTSFLEFRSPFGQKSRFSNFTWNENVFFNFD